MSLENVFDKSTMKGYIDLNGLIANICFVVFLYLTFSPTSKLPIFILLDLVNFWQYAAKIWFHICSDKL